MPTRPTWTVMLALAVAGAAAGPGVADDTTGVLPGPAAVTRMGLGEIDERAEARFQALLQKMNLAPS